MAEGHQIDGKHLMHQGTRMETGARKSEEWWTWSSTCSTTRTFLHTSRWEQQPPPWLVATAMKYVGFPHFDRLWPPTSHEQHCKSRDAKYLHLEDVEVKWRFLTILWAISEQTKWPKGSIPRSIASMMYAEHVLRVDVDWSTFRTEGFGAIGPGLLANTPFTFPTFLSRSGSGTTQNFTWIRKRKKGLRGRWRGATGRWTSLTCR